MIGALKGVPLVWQPPELVLDVQGVGYELQVPSTLSLQMGEPLQLYTHLIVRDDQMQLYGFESQQQRDVFRILLKINGVGAKMALAILTTWSVAELMQIIQQENLKALTQVPGVGKKTAERLLVELKHKFAHAEVQASATVAVSVPDMGSLLSEDILAQQALEQLGYKPQEAARLVNQVAEAGLETAEIIKRALKQAQVR